MAKHWIARARVNTKHLHDTFVTGRVWFTNAPRILKRTGKISCGDKIALVVAGSDWVFALGKVVSEKAAAWKETKKVPYSQDFRGVLVDWDKCGPEEIMAPSHPTYRQTLSECRPEHIKAIWK
ncbi:MAG: hypothetical protein FWG50_10545 [Kiritimatiellaeota bacterium]|nr:hypothetical protein [Kiritimatiellota bacterium]